jgi:hypothetical protein
LRANSFRVIGSSRKRSSLSRAGERFRAFDDVGQ